MIDLMKRELGNNRGVTIVFSLVAFLFAAMISFVVVNTALGNAKRASLSAQQNQDFHTVESVAKIIRDSIISNKIEYEITVTTTEYRLSSEEGRENIPTDESESETVVKSTRTGENAVTELINDYVISTIMPASGGEGGGTITPEPGEGTFDFKAQLGDGTDASVENPFKPVQVDVKIDPDYDLQIVISLKDTTEEYKNLMTLTAKGHIQEGDAGYLESEFEEETESGAGLGYASRTVTEVTDYSVFWDNLVITKGLNENDI